jgi:hypothetical protein
VPRLELLHGFNRGVVPLAAWRSGKRAVFGEGLLNLGNALGSRCFLALLALGMFAGLLHAGLTSSGSRWPCGAPCSFPRCGFRRRRWGRPCRSCCEKQRQACRNRRPKFHRASIMPLNRAYRDKVYRDRRDSAIELLLVFRWYDTWQKYRKGTIGVATAQDLEHYVRSGL